MLTTIFDLIWNQITLGAAGALALERYLWPTIKADVLKLWTKVSPTTAPAPKPVPVLVVPVPTTAPAPSFTTVGTPSNG